MENAVSPINGLCGVQQRGAGSTGRLVFWKVCLDCLDCLDGVWTIRDLEQERVSEVLRWVYLERLWAMWHLDERDRSHTR